MNAQMIETMPQAKRIFAKEVQTHIHELKNKILELDLSLPNFLEQIDGLISSNKLLQDAAIRANFYIPNSPVAEIIHHFEEVINLLRDRHSDIDWITKELLLEAVNMSSQIINEYCLRIEGTTDWNKLQHNLFAQINEHLLPKTDELITPSFLTNNNKAHEPFNLDDTPEALHLFDIDFDMSFDTEDNEGLYQNNQNNQLDNSDSFFVLQLDREDNHLEQSTKISKEDLEINSDDNNDNLETLFPGLFTNFSTDLFTENLDDLPDNLEDLNQTGDQENLPIPEILSNIFLTTFSEQSLGDHDQTELLANEDEATKLIESDLNDAWTEFVTIDSSSSINNSEPLKLEVLENNFDDFDNFNLNDIAIDIDIIDDLTPNNFFESLKEDDNIFKNLPEINQELELDQLEQSAVSSDQPNLDNSLVLTETLQQNFSTSDIDTYLEESPIYQNTISDISSSWEDVSQISLDDREMSYAEFSNLSLSKNHEPDRGDIVEDVIQKSGSQLATMADETAIRIPINHLKFLGDLSEELLVRRGILDIYLGQIRLLSGEAQKHLQLLEPNPDVRPQ